MYLTDQHAVELAHLIAARPGMLNLGLGKNYITDVGATAIADVLEPKRGLFALDFSANPIGDDGVVAIAQSTHYARWDATLWLHETSITDACIPALVRWLGVPGSTRTLVVNGTNITCKGVLALAKVMCKEKVRISVYYISWDAASITELHALIPFFLEKSSFGSDVPSPDLVYQEAPVRRSYFEFFAGSEERKQSTVVARFGARDGDTAIRRRVLKFLVR